MQPEAVELMHWTFPWLGDLCFSRYAVDWFYNGGFTDAWNGLPAPPYPPELFTHWFHRMSSMGMFTFAVCDRVTGRAEDVIPSYDELLHAVCGRTSGPKLATDLIAEGTAFGQEVFRECLKMRPYHNASLLRSVRTLFDVPVRRSKM